MGEMRPAARLAVRPQRREASKKGAGARGTGPYCNNVREAYRVSAQPQA
jgi:hypothetical protein